MKGKAIWFATPTLLEPMGGPWGEVDDAAGDPAAGWRAILDWAARLKVDRIIAGVAPQCGMWSLHYLCLFPDHPAARCLDDDTVRRNIETVREIAAYGRRRGVSIMLHHYNFLAPERWVDSQPVLAKKVDAVDDPTFGRRHHWDGDGFLIGYLCWSEKVYQEFLKGCWRELMANVPEMGGLMITPGEFNYCRCEACSGGVVTDIFEQQQTESRSELNESHVRMCLDFVETFKRTMKELDKIAIVRTWMVENWIGRLSTDGEHAGKFSLFDACWGGPDPAMKEWTDAGYRLWSMKATGEENSGPIIWHDEKWCAETAAKCNELDTVGTMMHLSPWKTNTGASTFASSCNIQRFLENLSPAVRVGRSLDEFCEYFGPDAGEKVHQAAALIASVPLNMTAVVHLKREGFTYPFFEWFDGPVRWPGVLGTKGFDPPEWANPDRLTTLNQLLAKVQEDPDSLGQVISGDGADVLGRLGEMTTWAREAAGLLESCPTPAGPAPREELAVLIASAHIADLLAEEYLCLYRSRLAWQVVKTLPKDDPRASSAHESAKEHYRGAIGALRGQLEWVNKLAPTEGPAGKTAGILWTGVGNSIASRVRLRQAEYELIAGFLDGDGTVNWPMKAR